jgi:hypothetical protein
MTRCTACRHPERGRIEAELAEGRSQSEVARAFDLDRLAVRRHLLNHVKPAAQEPRVNGHATDDDPLVELVERLRPRGLDGSPAEVREYRLALAAVEARRAAVAPVRPLTESLEWQRLRGAILDALSPYPEARQAVADAIG